MRYPNGWVEYYTYDKMGRILKVEDTHPSEKPAKTQKHTYKYDANGNMVYEYMRGNGTGQAKNETLYTYDALNRLITAHDNYGNSTRTYTYDSLGNLTLETGLGSHNCDYIYNNLNQQIDRSSDNWNSHTTSAYDKRGNLILEEYIKNSKVTTAGAYTYDETNKMVRGINGNAEESIYTYNGLGALMEQTWIIAKNGYGYHDVSATAVVEGEVVVDSVTGKRQQKVRLTPEELEAANAAAEAAEAASAEGNITETTADANTLTATLVTYGNAANGNNGNNGNGNGNQDKPTGSDVKKTSTVVKQFVVDFSSETYKPLMEHEVNGLDYRYVYSDKARLSVVVQGIENGSTSLLDDAGELHAYYHCDYLGTTDYLTSAVNSKVISWTSYSEWGEITHNAVLKCGQRELDLVKEYATHDFDAVLNQYYAKARFYDADNRRFTAVDPILDPSRYDLREYVTDPMQLVQTLYVKDNAVNWIDLLGLCFYDKDGNWCHDRWEYLCGYQRKQEPMSRYLDGTLSESAGDFEYAVMWWSTHGVYAEKDLRQFAVDDYGRKIGTDPQAQNYNRYDDMILAFTNYWNKTLSIDIDPNVVKAMVYVESHVGYYTGGRNGELDVMQVLDDANPAIHRLAAIGNYDPNESNIPRTGHGLFKKLYCEDGYHSERATPAMSIIGGIRWLAYKKTPKNYNGGGDSHYEEKVNNALKNMV